MRFFLIALLFFIVRVTAAQNVCEHALDFSGSNSYVDCGPGNLLHSEGQLSMEAWVYVRDTMADQFIAGNYDLATDAGYFMGLQNGQLYCRVKDTSGTAMGFVAGVVPLNQWVHLAFTYKRNGRFRGYVNGLITVNGIGSQNPIRQTLLTQFTIGAASWNTDSMEFNGLIDEVRVWSVERTTEQIRESMRMNLTTTGVGSMFAYWRFDEGTGTFTSDVSGNGHHGTLSGSQLPVWQVSEGLYGIGNADLQFAGCCTLAVFSGTSFSMNVNAAAASADYVMSWIDCDPPGMQPVGAAALSDGYWVLDHYASSAGVNLDYKFTLPPGTISVTDEANPANIQLYTRTGNSTGSWSATVAALSASSVTGEVLFPGIPVFKQMVIGTSGNSTLSLDDSMRDPVAFLLSPQPAIGHVIVYIGSRLIGGELLLVDPTGRIHYRKSVEGFQKDGLRLDLAGLSSGVYTVIWTSGREKAAKKLVILN